MPRVFTYYDPDFESGPVGPIIRLWELSWRANGWKPRLLVPRLAQRHPDFKSAHTYWERVWLAFSQAVKSESRNVVVDFRTLNNGYSPKNVSSFRMTGFPETGALVSFSKEHTLEDMLTLGPYVIGV